MQAAPDADLCRKSKLHLPLFNVPRKIKKRFRHKNHFSRFSVIWNTFSNRCESGTERIRCARTYELSHEKRVSSRIQGLAEASNIYAMISINPHPAYPKWPFLITLHTPHTHTRLRSAFECLLVRRCVRCKDLQPLWHLSTKQIPRNPWPANLFLPRKSHLHVIIILHTKWDVTKAKSIIFGFLFLQIDFETAAKLFCWPIS